MNVSAYLNAPHRRRHLGALAVGLLLLSSTIGGALSLALFTDQETVDGTFTTGTILLDAARIDALTLTTTALMPGATITDDVIVENDGTADLRYALSTSSTNGDGKALRDSLTVTVRTIDVTAPASPCDAFDGNTLYSGTLGAASAGFGNASAGAQTGDRELAAGTSETLCIRVALPLTAPNAVQGATTTTTFTFDAEQTANNP